MKEIGAQIALGLLKTDIPQYLSEIMSLDRDLSAVPKKVFSNDDLTSILLVEEYPHGVSATITGFNEQFVEDCLRYLRSAFEQFALSSLDRRVFNVLPGVDGVVLQDVHSRRSFICTSMSNVPDLASGARRFSRQGLTAMRKACIAIECPPDASGARRLTPDDQAAVEKYPRTRISDGQPELAEFFQWSMQGECMEVYGVFEKDEIAGYLCCNVAYESIWDCAYIHIRPDWRRRGFGLQLATAYARGKLGNGQTAYWSGAANEASERTALKAGFVFCREVFWCQADSDK